MNEICEISANTFCVFLFETFASNRPFICDHDQNINALSANFTKWSNTLKQFVGNLPTNCLSVFDHFVGLALKGLSNKIEVFCEGLK